MILTLFKYQIYIQTKVKQKVPNVGELLSYVTVKTS